MTIPMIPIDILEQAARRCDAYLTQYGLIATWQIHVFGLRLVAEYGADKVEKTIYWNDLSQARLPAELIHDAEKHALSGLSN